LYIIQEHKEVLKYNAINNTVNRIIRRKKFQKTDVITARNSQQTIGLFYLKTHSNDEAKIVSSTFITKVRYQRNIQDEKVRSYCIWIPTDLMLCVPNTVNYFWRRRR